MNALIEPDSILDKNTLKRVAKIPFEINNFTDVPNSNDKKETTSWSDYYFKNATVIAAISEITKLQLDIRIAENQIANYCFNHIARRTYKIDQLIPVISADNQVVEEGERYSARIYLGAVDKSQFYQIKINGHPLLDEQDGYGQYETIASGLGKKEVNVDIGIKDNDGPDKHFISSTTYTVIPRKKK